MAAHPVQRMVEPKGKLVAAVAEQRQPLGRAHDHIEFIAVHDDVAPAAGRGVQSVAMDLDAAELHARIVAQGFVVIAGNHNQPRALADFPHQLLKHVVVRLRPMRTATDLPEIYDVADKIDYIGFAASQQIEQPLGLGGACAEMDVGDEQRTQVQLCGVVVRARVPAILHARIESGFRLQACDTAEVWKRPAGDRRPAGRGLRNHRAGQAMRCTPGRCASGSQPRPPNVVQSALCLLPSHDGRHA